MKTNNNIAINDCNQFDRPFPNCLFLSGYIVGCTFKSIKFYSFVRKQDTNLKAETGKNILTHTWLWSIPLILCVIVKNRKFIIVCAWSVDCERHLFLLNQVGIVCVLVLFVLSADTHTHIEPFNWEISSNSSENWQIYVYFALDFHHLPSICSVGVRLSVTMSFILITRFYFI